MREECSRSSLTSKRFSHQGKRGVPRTYLRRKVLKGIEGPSLENRMSIEGSHSGGNEKNRGPKRLPMGCSGSQRGLKERKRELFAGGGPGYWQKTLFAGGAAGYGQIWLRPDPHDYVPILHPHAYVPIPRSSCPLTKPAIQA